MKQEKCLECGAKVAEGHGWTICGNAVACSSKCANKAIRDYQAGRLRCWRCAEFINPARGAHTSSIVYGVYCSEECYSKTLAQVAHDALHCPTCNKPFIGAPYVWRSADGSEYCSKECRDARASGWTNVHDELPELGRPILIWATGLELVCDGARRGRRVNVPSGAKWETEGYFLKEEYVTHWQPLPEPPIVEQEEPAMGRCGDCCFWSKWITAPLWGRCAKANDPNARFGASGYSELSVRRDFGCVEFVRKGAD